MARENRYIFGCDAIEDAQALTEETGEQHYVYYQEPRFTGPAGACYYITTFASVGEQMVWPRSDSERAE